MTPKLVTTGILLTLTFSGVLAAEDNCSFLDQHLERTINSFIQKLPLQTSKQIEKAIPPLEGFETVEFTIWALSTLRPFGPFLTFCRNGSRFVQFDLVNKGPLLLEGTSVGNDSKAYQILSRALLVRFTAQFKVEGSGEGLKLHHEENLPVSMVGLNMILKIIDNRTKEELAFTVDEPKPNFLRTLWSGVLYSQLDKLFGDILAKK